MADEEQKVQPSIGRLHAEQQVRNEPLRMGNVVFLPQHDRHTSSQYATVVKIFRDKEKQDKKMAEVISVGQLDSGMIRTVAVDEVTNMTGIDHSQSDSYYPPDVYEKYRGILARAVLVARTLEREVTEDGGRLLIDAILSISDSDKKVLEAKKSELNTAGMQRIASMLQIAQLSQRELLDMLETARRRERKWMYDHSQQAYPESYELFTLIDMCKLPETSITEAHVAFANLRALKVITPTTLQEALLRASGDMQRTAIIKLQAGESFPNGNVKSNLTVQDEMGAELPLTAGAVCQIVGWQRSPLGEPYYIARVTVKESENSDPITRLISLHYSEVNPSR